MTTTIEITRTPDFAKLAATHACCFATAWDAGVLEEMLYYSGTLVFVAPQEMGFGMSRIIYDEMEILTLAVSPKHQGQGIGAAIVKAMLAQAEEQHIKSVFLEVREHNATARKLYHKAGFELLSLRKDYYRNADGTSEHAIIMRKTMR